MQIENYLVNSLPVVVIDDFYDSEAIKKIWHEIQFYSLGNPWLDPSNTGSATSVQSDGTQQYLKKNKGLFLDEIYLNRDISQILIENRKIFSLHITKKLIDINVIFKHITNCTRDCTLLSYYEDSDYYKPHTDSAAITVVSWFYNSPKKFQGGELIFENDLSIACEFNRTVVFPSILMHAVSPISMQEFDRMKNFGRYTITQLLSYK